MKTLHQTLKKIKRQKRHDLVKYGQKRFEEALTSKGKRTIDIDVYPHHFVLGCIMTPRMDSDTAWSIPLQLCQDFNAYDMEELSLLTRVEILDWFQDNPYPAWKRKAEYCYGALQHIHNEYNDDASTIWKDSPSGADVVCRFLQFKGSGVKVANMAAILLLRDYDIQLTHIDTIDVPPDAHVKRVFQRMGLIPTSNDLMVIYKARELCPEFPGIVDLACWEVGKDYCHPKNPECRECSLASFCPKKINKND